MSFIEFAATKMRSISRKKPFKAMTRTGLKPHCIATGAARRVVMAMSSDTASAGQVVGRPKRRYGAQRYDRQYPVHEGHINLSALEAGGVQHRRAGEEAKLDCLLGQRECAGNDRLRCDEKAA